MRRQVLKNYLANFSVQFLAFSLFVKKQLLIYKEAFWMVCATYMRSTQDIPRVACGICNVIKLHVRNLVVIKNLSLRKCYLFANANVLIRTFLFFSLNTGKHFPFSLLGTLTNATNTLISLIITKIIKWSVQIPSPSF